MKMRRLAFSALVFLSACGSDQLSLKSKGATPVAMPITAATPASNSTASETLTPVYESIHQNVFAAKCLTCHGVGGRVYNEVPLEPYAAMMSAGLVISGKPESSDLINSIESGSMPTKKSGLPHVTPDELAVIKTWILNGAPAQNSGTAGETPTPTPTVAPTATVAPTPDL